MSKRGRVAITLHKQGRVLLTLPDGDHVEIYVSDVQAGRQKPRVRLAIDAPLDVRVTRPE